MLKNDSDCQNIQLIICPNSLCGDCRGNQSPQNCKIVLSIQDSSPLVIVEPDQKKVHLRQQDSSSFESFYIERFDRIKQWSGLIGAYIVEPYLSLFFRNSSTESIEHLSVPRVRTSLEYSLVSEMVHAFEGSYKDDRHRRTTFQNRLDIIREWVNERVVTSLPEILPETRQRISALAAHQGTVLHRFFPLILDENVEEMYLDRPGEFVYFDHSKFGRVKSDFIIEKDEVSRFSTLLRAESNLHLDRKNPSLKTDLIVEGVPLRFSTSLPPLSPDGMNLEVRRARRKPFTLFDLIENGTLDVVSAALLITAINSRLNITITGEPGTGKTTLMNALDSMTPDIWRKIYIEDVIESRIIEGNHQIRFRVNPVEEHVTKLDKASEIVKSLHRSPDYLILGEIQTIEHSQALFQSIAAGLRSIQTCHSSSPSSLITRWTVEQNISPVSVALMDLIVSMKRPNPGISERYVNEIVEIRRRTMSGLTEFEGLNTIYSANHSEVKELYSSSAFLKRSKRNQVMFHEVLKKLQEQSSREGPKDFIMECSLI